MSKTRIIILVILGVLLLGSIGLGIAGFIRGVQEERKPERSDVTPLARVFEDALVARGIAQEGQPIEGFDATLLMNAFPGLEPEDFDGVEAFEGTYIYTGGELIFERTSNQPQTSAARTLAHRGYETLFENTSARLELTISDQQKVADLVDTLGGWSGIPPKSQWQPTTASGITFDYPAALAAHYIKLDDWPPQLQIVDEPYTCTESGDMGARAGGTEERSVSGNTYCVTHILEGAAGSVYSQYAYAFPYQSNTAILTFSTRLPQCENFGQPDSSMCQGERVAFNPDVLVNSIVETIR